ncbi:MAG TPA: hypothetical protein P5148_06675 [Anaerolineae bacterium]|nr:hypothetical protein [Anaerolineae bacterium]
MSSNLIVMSAGWRLLRTIQVPSFDNPSAAIVDGDAHYGVYAWVATDVSPETEYWLALVAR